MGEAGKMFFGASRLMRSVQKLALRAQTRLREGTAKWRIGDTARQVIFIHIPKSAGTSVLDYIQSCVGGRKSGRTIKLSELVRGKEIDEETILRARHARFCTGHISWPTVERVRGDRGAFVFTILREPRKRLWSFYNYLKGGSFPASMIPPELVDLYAEARKMSARDFFTSGDPRLTYMIDNIMVRQLGGGMDQSCLSKTCGRVLLKAAKHNLGQLDHVGFTDGFETDFPRIIAAIDLPAVSTVPRSKVSQPWLKKEEDKRRAFESFVDEVGTIIESFVRWDEELYRFAKDTRRPETSHSI